MSIYKYLTFFVCLINFSSLTYSQEFKKTAKEKPSFNNQIKEKIVLKNKKRIKHWKLNKFQKKKMSTGYKNLRHLKRIKKEISKRQKPLSGKTNSSFEKKVRAFLKLSPFKRRQVLAKLSKKERRRILILLKKLKKKHPNAR